MKGFMHWFKSSTKMKRWIFLILIGIILACYGIAEILVLKEVSFQEVGKIIGIFVVGFLAIVIGLIYINKRTLELLVESTDDRMENKKNVNIKSLIFNKKIYEQGPNIVVIGGGTGLNTVLSGLKKYTDNLTAIVTVSDYGEEASISRKELGTRPLDDIRDSIVSLENEEDPFMGGLTFVANIRDKRNQKLAGMSGGEKSLTALAFVFAIQKYLPAPFYAFDEVDMHLDGPNVEKLAQIITNQSKTAQFIVVSLRKPMLDNADRMIGVTQKDKGVTKISGIKIKDE